LELGRGQVVLKFQEPGATLTLTGVNDLIVDSRAREVWFRGSLLSPTPKEYSLLEHLYLNRGEACSKDSLAQSGWPEQKGQVGDQDIEQIIKRLRHRIEPSPSKPQVHHHRQGLWLQVILEVKQQGRSGIIWHRG
jgi:DNA-binding response OmpR family regulator